MNASVKSPRSTQVRRKTRGIAMRRPIQIMALVASLVLFALPKTAHSQQRSDSAERVPDLVAQNLSRVSASAAEIKSVLLKDSGLLVELKRWVARDVSGHGQIISDADLTNDAIFERLETDVQFRSVATAFVQRYGYLLPKLNPDSVAAKEQELLIQERTKWLAQREEEQLAQARQPRTESPQNLQLCDPRIEKDCQGSETQPVPAGSPRRELQPQQPQDRNNPGEQNPMVAPGGNSENLMRAQLTQPEVDSSGRFSEPPPQDPYAPSTSLSTVSTSTLDVFNPQNGSTNTKRSSPAPFADANGDSRNASDGLLAAYGNEIGMSSPNGAPVDMGATMGGSPSFSGPSGNTARSPILVPYRRSPSTPPPAPGDGPQIQVLTKTFHLSMTCMCRRSRAPPLRSDLARKFLKMERGILS